MTIETQVQQILGVVNAQTQAIASLATAVSAIPTAAGSTPADNSAVLEAVQKLQATADDIQAQLETPVAATNAAPEPTSDAAPDAPAAS